MAVRSRNLPVISSVENCPRISGSSARFTWFRV